MALTLLGLLAPSVAFTVAPMPHRGGVMMCATPEWADASALLGEWELEEREDALDCKTLVMLHEDGTVTLGATSGPLPIAERSCCTWAASAHVTDVSTEISMDIVLERRFPGPTASVMLEASEIPDEDTYVTRRILRGLVSDGVVPGTFALVGEIDVVRDEIVGDIDFERVGTSSDECVVTGRMAEGTELVGVGYFTMIKVPDADGAANFDSARTQTAPSDGKTSRTSTLYNQGASDATRQSLAERFGEESV